MPLFAARRLLLGEQQQKQQPPLPPPRRASSSLFATPRLLLLLLLLAPGGALANGGPAAGATGLGTAVDAAAPAGAATPEEQAAAEAAAAPVAVPVGRDSDFGGDLLARLAGNIDTIEEIFDPAAEAARSNLSRSEDASFGHTGPVVGPRRAPKGGYCAPVAGGSKTWCPQACLTCWKRDHAAQWLQQGNDEHLARVELVRAFDRKAAAALRLEREMRGLRNSTIAMQLSAPELQAKLAGKQLWLEAMAELEKVAKLVLHELDSMAAPKSEHAAALAGGTEQLKDVLQAVQYSVMIAERARVALSSNADDLTELEVLPCDGTWGEWSGCTNRTKQPRPCCTPCPKKIPWRMREEAEDYGRTRCSTGCVNASTVGVVWRQYNIHRPAQHGGAKCPHVNGAVERANCSLAAPVCTPKGFKPPKSEAAAEPPALVLAPPPAAPPPVPAASSEGTFGGQLAKMTADAENAANAAEVRHARSASAAVATAVDAGGSGARNGAPVMAELETVVRTGTRNGKETAGSSAGGSGGKKGKGSSEGKTGALIDGHDNQYTLMRPHDLTVPHQDVGLIEELLITLTMCYVLGAIFRFCGLPSFLGHMAAGTVLGPMGFGQLRHMVQLDSLGQLGVELFLFYLGLELDVSAFAAGPTARLSASIALLLTGVLVLGCAAFAFTFGTSMSDAVVIGGCLALSSTPVAVGALTKEEHREPHGELLLGVLIVQDGIFGVFLAVLSAVGGGDVAAHGSEMGPSMSTVMILLGSFGGLCWLCRRRVHLKKHLAHGKTRLHRCTRACCSWTYDRLLGPKALNDEAVLLGALAAMAAGRTATETLGLSGELGCLLMGLSVAPISTVVFPKDEAAAATSPSMRELSPRASGGVRLSPRAADDAPHGGHGEAGGRTAEIVLPVRDLLIALFFASCGQHLSPGFMRELLGTLASLALLAMGLKFTIVALTLRCLTGSVPTGASAKTVALTAAGLAQISEVSFFIAARAKRQGLIGRETHFVLLAITSLSLAFAPLVWAVVRYWAPEAAPTRSIAIPRGSDRFVVEEES